MDGVAGMILDSDSDKDMSVLWVAEGQPAHEASEFKFAVDASITELSILVSTVKELPVVTVLDPSGTEAKLSKTVSSENATKLNILAPASGTWRLQISAHSNLHIKVKARSVLQIVSTGFVRPGGRPGRIRDEWIDQQQGAAGACGLPISNEYDNSGGKRVDFEGGHLSWQEGVGAVAACGPASAPATPSSFHAASTTPSSVNLAWDDVSGETGYRIYKWNGSTIVLHAAVAAGSTAYSDGGLNCNSSCTYQLSAYNGAGESSRTGLILATTGGCVQAAARTVTTIAASSIGQTSATLNGSVNPNGAATTAYFQWGLTTNDTNTTQGVGIGAGSASITTNAAATVTK